MRFYLTIMPLALAALLASAAQAKTFSPAKVPAAAEAVVHLDVARLKKTSLGKRLGGAAALRKEITKRVNNKSKVKGLGKAVADIALSIRSFTLWVDAQEKGALIVDLDPKSSKAVTGLLTLFEAKSSTENGLTIYETGNKDTAYVANTGQIWVIAEDKSSLVSSISSIQGRSKSLGQTQKLGIKLNSTDIFFAAGAGGSLMNELRKKASAKSLQANIKTLALHLAESKDVLKLSIEANTDSTATANKLVSIASGLSALVSLADDEPELQEILRNLQVSAKGTAARLSLDVPTSKALKLLDSID
jgi:hypothetical protein